MVVISDLVAAAPTTAPDAKTGAVKPILWFAVLALAAILLIQVGAGALPMQSDPSADLAASWDVDPDGTGTIRVVVGELSGQQSEVDRWSITLIEIIPGDGRGGEGGSAVETVVFDYYVNLEAISQPAGEGTQATQLFTESVRLMLD